MERTYFEPLKYSEAKGFFKRNLAISSKMKGVFDNLFPDGMGTVLEFGTDSNFHSYLAASARGCDKYIVVDTSDAKKGMEQCIAEISMPKTKNLAEEILGYKIPEKLSALECVKVNMAEMPIKEESVDVALAYGLCTYDQIGKRGGHKEVDGYFYSEGLSEFDISYVQDYGDLPFSRAMERSSRAVKKGGIFIITDRIINGEGNKVDNSYFEESIRFLESNGYRKLEVPEDTFAEGLGSRASKIVAMRREDGKGKN